MRHTVYGMVIWLAGVCAAQAQPNPALRQQMDSEREGSFEDEKSYEKARKFIRMDSTYYLGYMLEGAYLFFRANDKLGFTKAAAPLEKALAKIETDYDKELRTRSNSYPVYASVYRYHYDYSLIAYFLSRCYQNVEWQDKAMEVLYHVRDYNFQLEMSVDSYNTMAWIVHRNRVYTSAKYPFLRNSVKENVHLANKLLDSAIYKLQRDFPLVNGLFDPSYLNRQYLSTFHYKAIIYDYKLDIDSANYFYDILIENGAYSPNNYAEFKLAMGELEEADSYFREAEERESNIEKTTKEYFYMRGTLETYQGNPDLADTLLTRVIKQQGSTPGYGWHQIGLARAKHFAGLTVESQEAANKAARFQELHIGTTWGQEQYNLAVASLNYINAVQFKKEFLFENDAWYFWLNPVNWYRWIKYSLEARHHKMILATLVAENPEREQVIYPIFSPENLMSFDEVWSVIEGFGNEYFIDIYEKQLATDKRPRVHKYIRYFLGRLYLAEGDEAKAKQYFQQVLRDEGIGSPFETLLKARVYEGLALASSGSEREQYTRQLYELYPQLVPFTDLTMTFQLSTKGAESEAAKKVLKELRQSEVDFGSDEAAPRVDISFAETATGLLIQYAVQGGGGTRTQGTLDVPNDQLSGAGKILAYRLFGIQKEILREQPKAEPVPQEEVRVAMNLF